MFYIYWKIGETGITSRYLTMAKLVLFLCLALAISAVSAESATAGWLDSIKGKAEEIKQDVTKRVNDAIQKIDDLVDEIREKFMQFVDRMQEVGTDIMDRVVNETSEMMNKVNNLIEDAKSLGIDISECVEQQEVVEKMTQKIKETVSACVNKELSETYKEVNEVYTIASAAIHDLKQILERMTNCGTEIKCYLQCVSDATSKTVSATAEITSKAYAIKTNVEKRLVTLPVTCGQQNFPELIESINESRLQLVECVQSKY